MPVAVVQPPRLGVREHLVRLGDRAEALLGVGLLRDVGMQLAGEPPERLLDLCIVGAALDAENLVQVALDRRHLRERSRALSRRRTRVSTRRESSNAAARTVRTALS